tara:strand:+ start:46676 stop:47527 length:852 start_codon:yes stop_codon:yes gene_type:complete
MPVTINFNWAPGAAPGPPEQAAINYAGAQWEARLNENMTINVQVWWVDMSATGLNGLCVPGIHQTATSTLTRPQAKQAGHIPSMDPNLDLVIVIDSITPWVLGTGPLTVVFPGQYSLSTTVMHELCHGLGFLGLCNVDNVINTGTYSAANTLVPLINGTLALMVPLVGLPAYFNLGIGGGLMTGFGFITHFADYFEYTNGALTKGIPADDFTAFTTANDIDIIDNHGMFIAEILTTPPFAPFTSCDHITGGVYLMLPTTVGRYFDQPDLTTLRVIETIGWTIQ